MPATQLGHRTRRTGYSNALSQPSVQISMVIECPPSIAFPGIDGWLKSVLDVDLPPAPRTAVQPKTFQEVMVTGLVWRVMALSAGLLQAVRVPVFDPGKICALRRKPSTPNKWEVVIAHPRIDHLSIDPFEPACQAALRVLMWLINRPRTPENTERLFRSLNDQFIGKIQSRLHGGDSTVAVLREAWKLGIEFRHLGSGTYQLGSGVNQQRVDRGANQRDSAIGCFIARDKQRSADLLRDAGLPAPVHLLATSEEDALAAAGKLGWPVVVKPLDRDRGEGISVNIRSDEELLTAFRKAIVLSRAVLVEAQVEGICHRVLVAQGKVWIVSKRLPKSVKGDGVKTVRDLVAQANAEEKSRPPWARLKPFPVDELAVASLAAVNLNLDSIPAAGLSVPLRPIQTSAWGGVVEDFNDRIHPDNIEIAVKAARLFGLSVAGVDIMSTDITRSWRETGAIINEVNFSPLLSGRSTGPTIAQMIDEWVPNRGRIPVEAVLGDDAALAEGHRIQSAYTERGIRCWLATKTEVITETGDTTSLSASGLYERCLAVLLDPQVEALVMVVQDNELLQTGLPVGRIDQLHEAYEKQTPAQEASGPEPGGASWAQGVGRLLRNHAVPCSLTAPTTCNLPPPASPPSLSW